MPDLRYISWSEYGNLTEALAYKVSRSRCKFDLVVGVARGGIPVAMVVSDRLGVKFDIVKVKSYTGIAKRSKPKILSGPATDIAKKRLLLVDDLVDQGSTMAFLIDCLGKTHPLSLKTAVLFKKPWSKVDPDFYLETVSDWIVFPFETGEVDRERREKQPRRP